MSQAEINPEAQVKRFYNEIWNQHDKSVIPQVLHEDFSFRGSLGEEKRGHAGFIEYLDAVHHSLANYHCQIVELVSADNRVFARMLFSGRHQNELLGFVGTGREVNWQGAALFHFDNGLVCSLWVLGDLKSLEEQLNLVSG